jgi:hypothetical protein
LEIRRRDAQTFQLFNGTPELIVIYLLMFDMRPGDASQRQKYHSSEHLQYGEDQEADLKG